MERRAMIERTGGPEVIAWEDVDLPPPGADEVRMRNTAVGLNYIDTYHRSGGYPIQLPGGLGSEAAGVIEAVGEGVADLAPGDRVATFGPTRGAYGTARNLHAAELFRLPDDVDDRTAAAVLLKGCTAEFLAERCARVSAGDTALVWAAAGGVGQILVGWLKHLGATVIGIVGIDAKAERVRALGADHAIVHRREDVAARVRELTGGPGVDVAFDSIGQATWEASLASVRRRGLLVSFGNAGGPVRASTSACSRPTDLSSSPGPHCSTTTAIPPSAPPASSASGPCSAPARSGRRSGEPFRLKPPPTLTARWKRARPRAARCSCPDLKWREIPLAGNNVTL